MIGRTVICSRCRREATCRAVLEVQHAPRRVFCDQACMVLFVREVYIEDPAARASAAPSSVVGPPSAAGGGTGAARVFPVVPSCSAFSTRRWAEFLRTAARYAGRA